MPNDDSKKSARSVGQKLGTMAAAARSAMGRYPQDVAESLRQRRLTSDPAADANEARAHPDRALTSTLPEVPLVDAWQSLPDTAGRVNGVCWLGHCSVLLKLGGQTVLTDPVFSPRIGVRIGPLTVGPKRLAAEIDVRSLPPVDLVLVSHAHFDHLDVPTLKALARKSTRVLTAAGTAGLIPRGYGEVSALKWAQQMSIDGMAISAMRPAHWGARAAWDRHRGFNSYLIDGAANSSERHRVLFAGDTAMTDTFAALAAEGLPRIDLGIFGIGAYQPWVDAHATPEQVVEMAERAGVDALLPVHHSTFRLSDEPMDEPMVRLTEAVRTAADRGCKLRVVPPRLGHVMELLTQSDRD